MADDGINYFGADPHLPGGLERGREGFEKGKVEPIRRRKAADEPTTSKFLHVDTSAPIPRETTRPALLRGAWVEVDLSAIAHNVALARRRLGPARRLLAVVKADGYGHGAVRVARTALKAGASRLGVATVEEGAALRQAGIDVPILVLSQPTTRSIPYLLAYKLTPVVYNTDFALALGEAADLQRTVAPYHLAVNTGMNRIGVPYADVVEFLRAVGFHRGIMLEGTLTHFATADDTTDVDFREQLACFQDALQAMHDAHIDPGVVHCANSAAIMRYPEAHYDMGRLGCTMYGLAPSPNLRGREDLRPAMSVKALVSAVNEPRIGQGVSYGFTYRTATPVQIATVPLGYADGLRRELSNCMDVLIHGQVCVQAGNICMDQAMVEVPFTHRRPEGGTGVREGDEVVIVGRQGDEEITADMMADQIGTINYEIVCAFGMRLPRIYV